MEELIKRLSDLALGEYNTYEVDFEDMQEIIEHLNHFVEIKKIVEKYNVFDGLEPDSLAEFYFKEIRDIFKG